jgi:hypothetical protein
MWNVVTALVTLAADQDQRRQCRLIRGQGVNS